MTKYRPRGFTLLELLIAVALFAVLSAIAYRGVDSLLRAHQLMQAEAAQFKTVQRFFQTLDRDLRQALPRAVRNGNNQREPAFNGGATAFSVTTQQLFNSSEGPRYQTVRVSYQLQGRKLYRSLQTQPDAAPNSVPAVELMLDDVDQFRLQYFDQEVQTLDEFPSGNDFPAQDPFNDRQINALFDRLPRALEVRFRSKNLGELRRVVAMSEADPFVEGTP